MIFRADYEHGAVGMRNDRVGDGSHQSPLERAQSPASQNDEVGAELLGRPNNLLGGNPDGRREVALGTGAFEALRKHRARQSEERLMLGSLYENLGLVFATAKGMPLEASNVVNRSFKPLLSGAGITPIKFHELRHTCASLMASADVPPKYAQDRLGHADFAVTMNLYSHVLPEARAEVARKIEAMIP